LSHTGANAASIFLNLVSSVVTRVVRDVITACCDIIRVCCSLIDAMTNGIISVYDKKRRSDVSKTFNGFSGSNFSPITPVLTASGNTFWTS